MDAPWTGWVVDGGGVIERSYPQRDVTESRVRPRALAQSLFAPLPRRYDALAFVLSLGQDRRWRRAMVDMVKPAKPGIVLDVASGPGAVTRELRRRGVPRVVALDVSEAMLRRGVANAAHDNAFEQVKFVVGGAEQLPFADGAFDALTFTYLLRYVSDPAAVLRELGRVVRPGGVMASLEFAVPPRAWWHLWWVGYTRLVLPVAAALTGGRAWWRAGRFLGPSISAHYDRYSLAWTLDAWRAAGFREVTVRRMSLGGGVVMSGVRES
ncbi:MAG TPA: class I SAM-dependent methyltransferase [Acidimicrobiales bacterium]